MLVLSIAVYRINFRVSIRTMYEDECVFLSNDLQKFDGIVRKDKRLWGNEAILSGWTKLPCLYQQGVRWLSRNGRIGKISLGGESLSSWYYASWLFFSGGRKYCVKELAICWKQQPRFLQSVDMTEIMKLALCINWFVSNKGIFLALADRRAIMQALWVPVWQRHRYQIPWRGMHATSWWWRGWVDCCTE